MFLRFNHKNSDQSTCVRLHCIVSGSALDQNRVLTAHKHQNLAMQFISPFVWAIGRRWFQVVSFLMGSYLFWSSFTTIFGFKDFGRGRYQSFKVDVECVSEDAPAFLSAQLHLKFRGCSMWSSENLTVYQSGSVFSFPTPFFSSSVLVDGFSVVPRYEWSSTMKGALRLKGSNNNGTSWFLIASSNSRVVVEGVRFRKTYSTLSWKHGNGLSFQNAISWPLALESVVCWVLVGLGYFGVSFFGVHNRPSVSKQLFVWCTITLALCNFLSTVGYLVADNLNPKEAFFTTVQCLTYSFMALVLHFAEMWFAELLIAVALLNLASRFVEDISLMDDPQYLLDSPPISPVIVGLAGFGFILSRKRYLAELLRKAGLIRARHDEEWQRLLLQPGTPDTLARLRRATARAGARSGAEKWPRQCNRLVPSQRPVHAALADRRDSSEDLGDVAVSVSLVSTRSESGNRDGRQPVVSMDQLYTQAMAMAPCLFALCKEWAAVSGGALDEELDCEASDTLPGWIKRRIVKRPERSTDKAAVCYGGDVSRLIDICRARLVFEKIEALCACLELIEGAWQTVDLLRIKNTMQEEHDSRRTAGFRAVIVNLCIRNEETSFLGIENHVCEVQLVLKKFMAFGKDHSQSSYGHSDYLKFRDMLHHFIRRPQIHVPSRSSGVIYPDSALEEPVKDCATREPSIDVSLEAESQCSVAQQQQECCESPECAAGDNDVGLDLNGLLSSDMKLFYNVFLSSALGVPNVGRYSGHESSILHEAFLLSSAGSVWFTSTPLVAAASKRVFQIIMLVLGLYFVYKTSACVEVLLQNGTFLADAICMHVNGVRDDSLPAASLFPNLLSLGPLYDGCKVQSNLSHIYKNGTICTFLNKTILTNGYYFVTGVTHTQFDPVRWKIEASADGGITWKQVSASAWRLSGDGTYSFYDHLSYPTTMDRGRQVDHDLRPPWPWVVDWLVAYLINALGFLGCVVAAVTGRNKLVKICWISFYLLGGIMFFIAAIGYQEDGNFRSAASCWLEMVPQLAFVIGFTFYESKMIPLLLFCSFSYIFSLAVSNIIIYHISWMEAVRSILLSVGSLAFVFTLVVSFFRRRTLYRSRKLVQQDQKDYDTVWMDVINTPDAHKVLADIKAETLLVMNSSASNNSSGNIAARQYQRKFLFNTSAGPNNALSPLVQPCKSLSVMKSISRCFDTRHKSEQLSAMLDCEMWAPETLDITKTVTSLDQLFVQASCIHPILLQKVKHWARISGGCFPCKGAVGFVKLSDIPEPFAFGIKWAKLKSITRAVEKVYRIYNKDVSRLIDICRQSIVFQDLSGIVCCLAAIRADNEIRVMRVKNRMDLSYDSTCTAGYRDIALNLRIVNNDTKNLGVDTHVCEVQLIHRAFAERKKNEGHARYVVFRNLRGE